MEKNFPWSRGRARGVASADALGCAARGGYVVGHALTADGGSTVGELTTNEGRLTRMFVLRRAFLKTMSTAVASAFITPTLLRAQTSLKSNAEV